MAIAWQIGQEATVTRTITEADVKAFADVIDDHNPIHLDAEYAGTTRFGRRIAHGMFAGGLISGVLATRLPGPGTIYLSQTLKFKAPLYVGEEVVVRVTVTGTRPDKPILTLRTECLNGRGEIAVEGEAVVLAPLEP